ncbi:YjfB family protein [Desulforamulus reducens]|uniref:YjfB family protein n=1 Tax=Desulforamulus reducens TaxID=59610 RepID=UPI0002F44640|nr:YjfB family protein [Desulforamulus reducens]
MDIAALSIIKNHVQIQQDVGVAVLKKAMNTAEENGNFLTQMLGKGENSIPQAKSDHLGNKIDFYV